MTCTTLKMHEEKLAVLVFFADGEACMIPGAAKEQENLDNEVCCERLIGLEIIPSLGVRKRIIRQKR